MIAVKIALEIQIVAFSKQKEENLSRPIDGFKEILKIVTQSLGSILAIASKGVCV